MFGFISSKPMLYRSKVSLAAFVGFAKDKIACLNLVPTIEPSKPKSLNADITATVSSKSAPMAAPTDPPYLIATVNDSISKREFCIATVKISVILAASFDVKLNCAIVAAKSRVELFNVVAFAPAKFRASPVTPIIF